MRHKEAPTVLATVASSKISSFRKDVIDEPSHQENLLKVNTSSEGAGFSS